MHRLNSLEQVVRRRGYICNAYRDIYIYTFVPSQKHRTLLYCNFVYLFQRAAVFKISKINLRSDPPLFVLSKLHGERLKGYFYKQDLQPVPELTQILSQIVDQRVKNGIKQIKIKKKNKAAEWKNLEDFFLKN